MQWFLINFVQLLAFRASTSVSVKGKKEATVDEKFHFLNVPIHILMSTLCFLVQILLIHKKLCKTIPV